MRMQWPWEVCLYEVNGFERPVCNNLSKPSEGRQHAAGLAQIQSIATSRCGSMCNDRRQPRCQCVKSPQVNCVQ